MVISTQQNENMYITQLMIFWSTSMFPDRSSAELHMFYSNGTEVLVWYSAREIAKAMDSYETSNGVHLGIDALKKVITQTVI